MSNLETTLYNCRENYPNNFDILTKSPGAAEVTLWLISVTACPWL